MNIWVLFAGVVSLVVAGGCLALRDSIENNLRYSSFFKVINRFLSLFSILSLISGVICLLNSGVLDVS